MSLLRPATVAEAIMNQLKNGERKTTQVLKDLSVFEGGITKQAFYSALRKLKNEEVVVVYGGRVAINTAWVLDMRELVAQMERSYLPENIEADLPALSQKESVSYLFSNSRHLDVFWGHSQSQIIRRTPASEPVYSYDPHYWFYIARKETESKLIDEITSTNRQFLMTVGGVAPLDKVLRADFSGDLRQYNMQSVFPKRNYYVVVIDDYITEVWLDENMTNLIDEIYERSEVLDDVVRKNFEKLLTIKARHRIKISRNARKAQVLKKKLGKDFFVRLEDSKKSLSS